MLRAIDPAAIFVHLGQSALVLRVRREELVITSDGFGLVPAGVQVRPADFARLQRQLPAHPASAACWRPAVVEPVDLHVRARAADPGAIAILAATVRSSSGHGMFDPSRQREDAEPLCATVLAGAPPIGILHRLIGAGPGSTPTGDDVVVGVLAGLQAGGHASAASALGRAVVPLLSRTTTASAHYLGAAAAGRFAERVHELLDGLRSAPAAETAMRAAARMGATSGIDLLAGIVAASRLTHSIRKTA